MIIYESTNAFPVPLTEDQELLAISLLGTPKSEEAKQLLVLHNLRLVAHIARRFAETDEYLEDFISEGMIGLIKAVNTFDPDKNVRLATYASRCIENQIRMYMRQNHDVIMEVSMEEPLKTDRNGNILYLEDILGTDHDDVAKRVELQMDTILLKDAIKKLSDRDRRIVEMRFGMSDPYGIYRTQKEVADMMGISQSYISRLEKDILRRLRILMKGI
ncbi:MAG: sigma-70 family RNA polymerase sigma factor [Blautia sp.]|nr:sigma-70 family RNA polymerase sigma factor [Blautia sp.]